MGQNGGHFLALSGELPLGNRLEFWFPGAKLQHFMLMFAHMFVQHPTFAICNELYMQFSFLLKLAIAISIGVFFLF